MAELLLPRGSGRTARRALAPLVGLMFGGAGASGEDPLIEGRAEAAFDSRAVLPRITVPVLLIAGDRDLAFPKEVIEETARLVPDCTLVWYEGVGHVRAATSSRLPHDIVAFANGAHPAPPTPRPRVPPSWLGAPLESALLPTRFTGRTVAGWGSAKTTPRMPPFIRKCGLSRVATSSGR